MNRIFFLPLPVPPFFFLLTFILTYYFHKTIDEQSYLQAYDSEYMKQTSHLNYLS